MGLEQVEVMEWLDSDFIWKSDCEVCWEHTKGKGWLWSGFDQHNLSLRGKTCRGNRFRWKQPIFRGDSCCVRKKEQWEQWGLGRPRETGCEWRQDSFGLLGRLDSPLGWGQQKRLVVKFAQGTSGGFQSLRSILSASWMPVLFCFPSLSSLSSHLPSWEELLGPRWQMRPFPLIHVKEQSYGLLLSVAPPLLSPTLLFLIALLHWHIRCWESVPGWPHAWKMPYPIYYCSSICGFDTHSDYITTAKDPPPLSLYVTLSKAFFLSPLEELALHQGMNHLSQFLL